ncbi:HD-GYP domain-containing protein [Azohydromonas caseinilytica]|uniref:HD-GYP domain, c-di-GMP phosphodiesterase class II (Or its inactivated variant) n=1 Tax=Azohydromonas caseinilytica TaxID=2728836 RepID=A0A848FL78_9BURK|nr:hypothetical protein [Azohydromonas caseinilytica]NML19010.1 hypothetical protein [Azohydromonas caseinilytica]
MPFDVFAEDGRLLLPANARLNDERVVARLRLQGALFVQPRDYDAWRRGMAKAVDGVLQQNAKLSNLARARPDLVRAEIPAMPGEEWEGQVVALDSAMQGRGTDKPWLTRVLEVQAGMRTLSARRMDEALFHLVYTGGNRTAHYTSRQALRCMLIAGEAARELKWDDERIALLDKVALTMNAGAWQLHDRMARHAGRIEDPDDRAQMDRHPADSAQMLQDSGVTDDAWLEAVRLHHDDSLASLPMAELSPGQQIAVLLRRVDRYSAMLSRRVGRGALSATQAAQMACLGADGRPDPIGSLVLKAVGLYPPGSYVTLASNESGIVLMRGARANQPMVAALLNAQGMVMAEPRPRDTSQPNLAVRAALRPEQMTVDPPLVKLQILWSWLRSQAVNAAASP